MKKAPSKKEAFIKELCRFLTISECSLSRLDATSKFNMIPNPNTQQGVILRILAQNRGKFVPLAKLMRLSHSAAVHSVVHSLRKRGWKIDNTCGAKIVQDGIRSQKSEYRLSVKEGGSE